MSLLAQSFANTLFVDDEDNENHDDEARSGAHCKTQSQSRNDDVFGQKGQREVELNLEHRFHCNAKNNVNNDFDHNDINDANGGDDDDPQGSGMKKDSSDFTETLSRQLWGVASFLAPPPPPPSLPRMMAEMTPLKVEPENDLAEEEDDDDRDEGEYEEEDAENLSDYVDVVGVTEEALAFAQNTAHHPETWLDFPLLEEEDFEDFDISGIQYKHALAIERLVPRLAALRIEFCPAHMSEGYFWMVYFVLLHPRLNKHDADLLSTPQLAQARVMWMQELKKRIKQETDWFERKTFYSQEGIASPTEHFDPYLSKDSHVRCMSTYAAQPTKHHLTTVVDTEEHSVECNEVQFSKKSLEDPPGKGDKELIAGPSNKLPFHNCDDDNTDEWLEETAKLEGFPATGINLENEEDVSFSDLEEDSDWTLTVQSK